MRKKSEEELDQMLRSLFRESEASLSPVFTEKVLIKLGESYQPQPIVPVAPLMGAWGLRFFTSLYLVFIVWAMVPTTGAGMAFGIIGTMAQSFLSIFIFNVSTFTTMLFSIFALGGLLLTDRIIQLSR